MPTHYQLQSFTHRLPLLSRMLSQRTGIHATEQPTAQCCWQEAQHTPAAQGRACCLHWILCTRPHSMDVHHDCSVITAVLFSVTQHAVLEIRCFLVMLGMAVKRVSSQSLSRRRKSMRVGGKMYAQRMFIDPSVFTPVKTFLNSEGQMT